MLPGFGLPFRGFLPAVLVSAGGFFCHLSAASISGVVLTRHGDRVTPVVHASVLASEAAGSDVIAVARTDDQGRFLFDNLPSPRVALSVRKNGFFTRQINGRESESVVLDCSTPADCVSIEFELGRSAVISGVVVDALGEPWEAFDVGVEPTEEGRRPDYTMTDDRGAFRFAGLQPGRYRIKAVSQRNFWEQPFESETVDVEVGEGGEVHGLQVLVRFPVEQSRTYTVSGKITGIDLTREGTHGLQVHSLPQAGGAGGSLVTYGIGPDGRFLIGDLSPGRYAFAYYNRTSAPEYRVVNSLPLGEIEVGGDIAGLVLTPLPPTGVAGTVKFETRRKPRPLQISLRSERGERHFSGSIEPPDFPFQFTALTPGTYRIEIATGWRENPDLYIKGFRRGDELSTAAEPLIVTEGRVDRFDLVVSDEMARVYGRVKAATVSGEGQVIQQGAQFQVALSGPNGRTRVTQADQFGRFFFDDVVPGKYRMCGWARLAGLEISEKAWQQAGGAVREFVVETGSDVEIDLTAVP